jgi:hypothetical protein
MSLLSSKKSKASVCSPACVIVKWVVALALFLVSIASLVGIYQTHVVAGGAQFGSTSGSLAILAFTASAFAWTRQMALCMKKECDVCAA